MKVNELFCRECVEQIYVPDVVRVDLLSIIEEKLKKAGLRLKSITSLSVVVVTESVIISLWVCKTKKVCMKLKPTD